MIHADITDRILRCAVKVHTALGPALPEKSYQSAMAIEMLIEELSFQREPRIVVNYRGVTVGQHRPDFIVEDKVVLEIKSASRLESVFERKVITYLKVTGLRVGLLLNFNVAVLPHGIKRLVNG
jgi:GxxExxY protein